MARIRAARHYIKPDSAVRGIAVRGRVGLKRDIKASLKHLKDLFNRKRALVLYQHGRTREIVDAIDWKHYREVLKAVFDRWAKVYEAGAQLGERKINGAFFQRSRRVRFRKGIAYIGKAIGDRFDFDRFDEATQEALRQAQDELIAQLTGDARDVIETTILNGARLGLGPDEIVDDIWSVIGLTDTQAQAVLNYENMLRTLDSDALRRQLRDDAYDRAVQDAIETGSPLSESIIGEMVDAYEDNYYDYRANMIARTESSRAAHQGLHDSYRQAIDRGALPNEAVRRHWLLGDAPCPVCESVVASNPDGVGVDEDFDSDDGPQDDPPIHPHCECEVDYVTDLTLVPEDEEE